MLDTILLNREEIQDRHEMLKNLPENQSIFKCHSCKQIFNIYSEGLTIFVALAPKDNVQCSKCKTYNTELACKVDVRSIYLKLSGFNCRKGVLISGADICPVCNVPMCPECNNHNVVSWSRITGYLNDISGWNMAKKQELMDRKRYVVGKAEILA